jgi:hypothetical protein
MAMIAITTSNSIKVNPVGDLLSWSLVFTRTAFQASARRHFWLGLPGIPRQIIPFAGDFNQPKN